jgi:hypothetical protein
MINAELDVDNYHNVGISLLNRNFPDSKPSWSDVYSLTEYYYNSLFEDEEYSI